MKHPRAVLPPRTDLTSLRKRRVAKAASGTEDLYERLKSRLLPGVTPPTEDPFYRVPDNLEAFRPGEVLEDRSVEVRGFRGRIDADAWQVKFRSSDTTGTAVSGVATVMVPRRSFDGPIRPLLSYQCAIDALGATADPSYTLRRGDQMELPLIALALRRGWAVVTTDYNGPQHAFCAFPLVARFLLDGIRAAIGCAPAGFDAATPIGLWGYSGGAIATLFAVELQRAYAPELNIVGAAAGAAGVDMTIPGMRAVFETLRLGQATPMIPLHVYHAVHDKYPAIADVDTLVDKYRREGVDVTYRRFRFGGHVTVARTGAPGALRFLSERFGAPERR